MTQAKLPPEWATNENYSTGPDVGTATKVDPSSPDDGFIRGVVAAAQHVNFLFDKQVAIGRRAFQNAALKMHRVDLEGTSITDTAESMAAVQRAVGTPLMAIKTAQALVTSDIDRFVVYGVPASITSLVTAAAAALSLSLSGRIVAIGTGGNKATYSDDDGATWTASANDMGIAGAGCRIVWTTNAASANGTWFVGRPGSTEIRVSNVGGASGTWTSLAASLPTGVQGMAARDDGQLVVLDAANTVAFDVGPSGGFLSTGGTVANAADFEESGDIASDGQAGGAYIYHVGRRTGSASLQVSRSPDGVTWTTLASVLPPGGGAFSGRPRLMMCHTTGLLVIVVAYSSGAMALYASLDGIDWVGPSTVFPTVSTDAFALAGGRLFCTFDDMLFASDGIGVE